MQRFKRQTSTNGNGKASNANVDFGAAKAKIARSIEADNYRLRVESARIIGKNHNTLIVLDLVEVESGRRIAVQPLWVDGPNADAGDLAAENRYVIAQLLELAKLPTSGNPSELIPQLVGLEFGASLGEKADGRTGRSFNIILSIYDPADPDVMYNTIDIDTHNMDAAS